MARFNSMVHFPLEILLMITENIEYQRDLSTFIRTCKALYRIFRRRSLRHNIRYHGSTALNWAARNGRTGLVKLLQRGGATIESFAPGFTGVAKVRGPGGAITELVAPGYSRLDAIVERRERHVLYLGSESGREYVISRDQILPFARDDLFSYS
ncbi:uncharacterized protein BDV14DRAFT_97791 [Aspergillus stella-maris]|uniref:uncharacterized protein n=1 Tax=Aspergillus stella-maris TaxID=1810926 RepID=UPI003CCD9280